MSKTSKMAKIRKFEPCILSKAIDLAKPTPVTCLGLPNESLCEKKPLK